MAPPTTYKDINESLKSQLDDLKTQQEAAGANGIDVGKIREQVKGERAGWVFGATQDELDILESIREAEVFVAQATNDSRYPDNLPTELKTGLDTATQIINDGVGRLNALAGSNTTLDPALEEVRKRYDDAAANRPITPGGTVDPSIQGVAELAGGTTLDPDGKELDTSAKAIQVRNALQCFLLFNMDAFVDYYDSTRTADTSDNIDNNLGYLSPNLNRDQKRIILTSDETPGYSLFNKLYSKKGTKQFKNIQSHEYAQLMPMLRIYKLYVKRDGTTQKVEIDFSNFTTLDGIAKQLTSNNIDGSEYQVWTRGSEVGVKSFDWSFLGTDDYTATRDISATLKLTAQNFAPLAKIRKGIIIGTNEPKDYRYMDLFVNADCANVYSADCYRIVVEVGYATPGNVAGFQEGLKENIPCQKDTLTLTMTDHGFQINEDGSLDITLNYRGYIETVMASKETNIFLPAGGNVNDKLQVEVVEDDTKNLKEIQDRLVELAKKPSPLSEADEEEKKKLESATEQIYLQYKQIVNAGILLRLQKKNLIYEYPVEPKKLKAFKNYGSNLTDAGREIVRKDGAINIAELRNDAEALAGGAEVDIPLGITERDEASEAVERSGRRIVANNETAPKVRWFYFGDLISTILANITGDDPVLTNLLNGSKAFTPTALGETKFTEAKSAAEKKFEDFRVILGNLDVEVPTGSNATRKINLAKLPISLDSYTAFYTKNVIANDRRDYPFFDFVNDVLAELIMEPLSSACFGGLYDTRFRPKVGILSVPGELDSGLFELYTNPQQGGDNYNILQLKDRFADNPVFDSCIPVGQVGGQLRQYLVITSESTDVSFLEGKEDEDFENGIIHLHIGNINGILKKVNFSKTDQEYLPEARFKSEGNFLFNQLANVYDVNIELIGNNLFRPGIYVYINTHVLGAGAPWNGGGPNAGRSWANLMGLGGYHLITEVAHSISQAGFNTSIKARWTSSGLRRTNDTDNPPDED